MTGSSSDETAGRVRAWLDVRTDRYDSRPNVIEHVFRYHSPTEAERLDLTVADLRALLDEREQLRATITADGEHSWALAMERDAATARAEQAEARLAEIGELHDEWNVGSDDGEPNFIRNLSEGDARYVAGRDAFALLHRHVSDWRKIDNPKQRQGSEEGTT